MTDIYDNYANEELSAGKATEAVNVSGNKVVHMLQTIAIAPSHGAGAVYRLFRIGANMIPLDVKVLCSAVTGAADCDIGLYEEGVKGKALAADILADGLTLATATGITSPLNGLKSLSLDNVGKRIYELAGHSRNKKDTGYDVCLTANSAATAAGKAVVIATFVQG